MLLKAPYSSEIFSLRFSSVSQFIISSLLPSYPPPSNITYTAIPLLFSSSIFSSNAVLSVIFWTNKVITLFPFVDILSSAFNASSHRASIVSASVVPEYSLDIISPSEFFALSVSFAYP